MSAESPRRSRGATMPAVVPPQVVSDRSILDSAIGFINDVTLAHQPHTDPKDTITWARFESTADISDPRFGEDWELEGNVAPPLLLILGYGLGVQVWAIPANGEAVEVLSWRHGVVSALHILPTPATSSSFDDNGRADEQNDVYIEKRPLMALVDSSVSIGTQPQLCAVNFVSLKTGAQVKTIKFKNTVLDVLANRSSIVITFHERIAIFDARSLEDRLSITTCYPSPGINPNPVALGSRWLAFAENRLNHSKRSGAGCDGDGVASYTATVLNAAKSFGKGLRELGEQVAAGLTGTTAGVGISKNNSFDSMGAVDAKQPGIITIMDIKHPIKGYSPTSGAPATGHVGSDPVIAHFIAHSEAIVAMEFDNSGMLLLTADRRGHDFHIFRIHPHPVGPSLSAVHHLYILHRGDTSAKVQNVTFSLDSRWVAVSTLRGTTHVFPITPYGGPMGVRTHTSLHVVNKLSRFHRSAGLSADGRSNSPISHSESTTFVQSLQPYHNPSLPPFPRPIVVLPLAQLRQPFALSSPPGNPTLASSGKSSSVSGSGSSQRQRLSSLSDDTGKPLSVCAIFAKSRSWLLDPPNTTREAPHRIQRKSVDSLFVMAGHGALIQYDLDTKLASNVAKEKICDDTPIELQVEAKAQWNLCRQKEGYQEIMPPLSLDNWLIKNRNSCTLMDSTRQFDDTDDRVESWLSQVEIITHAGPHRRLWMGPQFVFKTYNTPSGSNLNHVDVEAVEVGISKTTAAAASAATRLERSSPLNMPLSAGGRSAVPVLIESGSYSSIEQSPKLMDRFRHDQKHLESDSSVVHGDIRLKEDLADAMRESPSVSATHRETGRLPSDATSSDNVPFYDALAEHDDDDQDSDSHRSISATSLASVLPNIASYDIKSGCDSLESLKETKASIEKIVNPLGTVTIVSGMTDVKTDILDEVVSQLAAEECVIHENCDESLFRPVVTIFCDDNLRKSCENLSLKEEQFKPPEVIKNKLIVPVIAKEVDVELSQKEKNKIIEKTKLRNKCKEFAEEQRKLSESRSIYKTVTNTNIKKDTATNDKLFSQTAADIKISDINKESNIKCLKKKENKVEPVVVEVKKCAQLRTDNLKSCPTMGVKTEVIQVKKPTKVIDFITIPIESKKTISDEAPEKIKKSTDEVPIVPRPSSDNDEIDSHSCLQSETISVKKVIHTVSRNDGNIENSASVKDSLSKEKSQMEAAPKTRTTDRLDTKPMEKEKDLSSKSSGLEVKSKVTLPSKVTRSSDVCELDKSLIDVKLEKELSKDTTGSEKEKNTETLKSNESSKSETKSEMRPLRQLNPNEESRNKEKDGQSKSSPIAKIEMFAVNLATPKSKSSVTASSQSDKKIRRKTGVSYKYRRV